MNAHLLALAIILASAAGLGAYGPPGLGGAWHYGRALPQPPQAPAPPRRLLACDLGECESLTACDRYH
jgi:hypothetical protein